MRDNIISYIQMCTREGLSLQRGMNFRVRGGHSVILMSLRPNAPYHDKVEENGSVLIYEGHDMQRNAKCLTPKDFDQPEFLPSGKRTANGLFHQAAQDFKLNKQEPDLVRVYEKIKDGIWADNGLFHLVDSWIEKTEKRTVFKFKLLAIEADQDDQSTATSQTEIGERSRIIPTAIKLKVWQRDQGKCIECGAIDELHFDHILPYSKGGTSLKEENIQLLCARHNLSKSAKIQ